MSELLNQIILSAIKLFVLTLKARCELEIPSYKRQKIIKPDVVEQLINYVQIVSGSSNEGQTGGNPVQSYGYS